MATFLQFLVALLVAFACSVAADTVAVSTTATTIPTEFALPTAPTEPFSIPGSQLGYEHLSDLMVHTADGADAMNTNGLTCFNNCFGPNKNILLAAVQWFCSQQVGHIYQHRLDQFAGTMHYNPVQQSWAPGQWQDEGEIEVVIVAIAECGSFVPYDTCMWNFVQAGPVENCNPGNDYWKQGGFLDNGCLRYDVVTNPKTWPMCQQS